MTAPALPVNAQKLAEAIIARRGELRISAEHACTAAGVSRSSWRAIEHAERPAIQTRTLYGIDHGLQWPLGMALALYMGRERPPEPPEPKPLKVTTKALLRQISAQLGEVLERLDKMS